MGLECIYRKQGNIIFVWLFWNSTSITYWHIEWSPWMCPGHVCIVGHLWGLRIWEDLGSEIEMCNTGCLHIQTWLQCSLIYAGYNVCMVVVGGQAPGGRLSISNHHIGSAVVWCGSCFAMERLTAAYTCTNLMLTNSLIMNLDLVTIRHFNIFRPSSETFKNLKTYKFVTDF